MSAPAPTPRQQAVEWMARKLRRSTERQSTYSWYVSGDALDDPTGPPHGTVRDYLVDLYENGTLAQIRRFKSDCFARAERDW